MQVASLKAQISSAFNSYVKYLMFINATQMVILLFIQI